MRGVVEVSERLGRVGKARQPHALPTPTTTCSMNSPCAGAGKETVEQVAHAGRQAWAVRGKLLGMFRKAVVAVSVFRLLCLLI